MENLWVNGDNPDGAVESASATDRYVCFFCGGNTDGEPPGFYLELQIRAPGSDHPDVQLAGVHAGCLASVVAPDLRLEIGKTGAPSETAARPQHLFIPPYDPYRGSVAPVEGGFIEVALGDDEIVITGDAAGLRDLARWCLAIADPAAPEGAHVHLDPNVVPLSSRSEPLRLERANTEDLVAPDELVSEEDAT